MGKEKYLDNSNYDFYAINLGKIKPFTSSKIIEKKIYANLEKLHPCFSDFSTFDYVITQQKQNIIAKVVVIDTLFLIEYKNSHKVSFVNVSELKNKKCFISEKEKKQRKITFAAIFILLAVSCFFMVFNAYKTKKQILENIPVLIETPEEKIVFDITDFIEKCLPIFFDEKIKVSYFEYICVSNPQITLNTSGIQREEIEKQILSQNENLKLNFSSTTYSDKTPQLSFSINCDKQPIKTASFCDIQSSFILIRNAVFEVNGLPVSEEIETRQFQCIIPYGGLKVFFDNLIKIQEEEKIKFEKLIFDYNQEVGNLNCVIVLDKLKADETIDFSNLLSIFKKPLEQQKINEIAPKKEVEITDDKVLVGKMPSADGSEILYYRTSDGKIVYEKE